MRIPESLWQPASTLLSRDAISRTALRLSYPEPTLKSRFSLGEKTPFCSSGRRL
ncbi:hypothetical protein [Thermopirellula anaerolimosa]